MSTLALRPQDSVTRTGQRAPQPLLTGRLERRETILAGAIFLAGTLAEWLRLPPVVRGTMWAEDVRNFLGNAVSMGPAAALFRPYSGYLHTIPRAIAALTVLVAPISAWATTQSLAACAVVAGVAALVFVCSRDVVTWLPARVGLAAITLLLPLAPHEVLGNTANLHWYFLWLAPWLMLARPRSTRGSWWLGVAALLGALTEIQMVLFAPLVLLNRHDRSRWPVRVLYLCGCAVQVAVTLTHPRGGSPRPLIGIPSLVYGYLINAALSVWDANPASVARLLTEGGPLLALAAVVPFGVAALLVLRWGTPRERRAAVLLGAGSLLLWCLSDELDREARYDYAAHVPTGEVWLSRYGVVPSLMLLALIPIAASALHRVASRHSRPLGTRIRLVGALGFLALIAALVPGFSAGTTVRSNGPVWAGQVVRSAKTCETSSPGTLVRLSGAPAPNWSLELSCRQLLRNRF